MKVNVMKSIHTCTKMTSYKNSLSANEADRNSTNTLRNNPRYLGLPSVLCSEEILFTKLRVLSQER